MDTAKQYWSLWKFLIAFLVILFVIVVLTNRPLGVSASVWVIPILMAVFGSIGALIGGVLGGIVGLIGAIFKKKIFIVSMKYGAAIGLMGLLVLWYVGCWMNGSSVCIAQ